MIKHTYPLQKRTHISFEVVENSQGFSSKVLGRPYFWWPFPPCQSMFGCSFILALAQFVKQLSLSMSWQSFSSAACEDSKKAKGSSRVRHKNPFLIKACHFNQVPANLNNSCTQSQPLTYEDRHFFWELNWVEKEPPSWLFGA